MGRETFKNWLQKNGYSKNTSDSYSYSIDKISKHISTKRNESIDVYSINELPFLKKLVELYSTIGNYSDFGYEGNGTVRNAIKAYYMFKVSSDEIPSGIFEETEIENSEIIENITNFSYERDLKNAMVSQISDLFPDYQIFGRNNEGVEYLIEGKRVDLLLESKGGSLLAVELKSGLADYKVFGQISMYLGLLMDRFPDKQIKGCIVAGQIDNTLKSATKTSDRISLMTYAMKLELTKE